MAWRHADVPASLRGRILSVASDRQRGRPTLAKVEQPPQGAGIRMNSGTGATAAGVEDRMGYQTPCRSAREFYGVGRGLQGSLQGSSSQRESIGSYQLR